MRVMVIGCSGAGKTTLASRLANELDVPHYSLDLLFWKPNWVETPDSEFFQLVEAAVEKPAWVMDGTYSRTLSMRLKHADVVIWLDVPRNTCITRVLKRVFLNIGRVRKHMPPGCCEHLNLEFLQWIWSWRRTHVDKLTDTLSEWIDHDIQPGWNSSSDGTRRVWLGSEYLGGIAELKKQQPIKLGWHKDHHEQI